MRKIPFYDDHPIRLLLRQAGMRKTDLARAAGVTYGVLDKLLMGMTATPHPEVVRVLSRRTGVAPSAIRAQVQRWNETPLLGKLSPRARAMLALSASDVELIYGTFKQWREEFAENPTQFASLLRIPRATLVEFEEGRRKVFPPTLADAIRATLGVPEDYLEVLRRLPPSEAPYFAPKLQGVPATVVQLGTPPSKRRPPAGLEQTDTTEEEPDVLDE